MMGRLDAQRITPRQVGVMTVTSLTLMILTCGPALTARFAIIDDHEILRFSHVGPRHPQAQPAETLAHRLVVAEFARGRFRPMHYVSRFALSWLLGNNAALWHALFLLTGATSLLALCYALHSVTRDLAVSLLFITHFASIRGVSESWVRLGVNETVGFFFLAIAAAAYVKAHAAREPRQVARLLGFTILAVALAMLSKESFILLGPAVIFLHVLLGGQGRDARKLRARLRDRFALGILFLTGQYGVLRLPRGESRPPFADRARSRPSRGSG
jgi:hypothetical protein